MGNDAPTLTLKEAAFVFGTQLKDIVRLVDEHSALTFSASEGGRRKRLLRMPDLVYLQALYEIGDLLTPEGRLRLHEALVSAPARPSVKFSGLEFQTEDIQQIVKRKLDALSELKSQIDGDPEDPLIKGTSVELYRVAALHQGEESIAQIKDDYPQLSEAQIRLAILYAQIIPKQGRPYPKRSFRQALKSMNFDALDDLDEQA